MSTKSDWAREQIGARLHNASSKKERKKVFKQVWKEAKERFG